MTFTDAIQTCFSKYADFDGRASRSEYWYFVLFIVLTSIVLSIIGRATGLGLAATVFSLVTLVPSLAAGARRLHDSNRSGWLLLLSLIPLVGWIIVLVFLVQEPRDPNQYGTAPGAPSDALLS